MQPLFSDTQPGLNEGETAEEMVVLPASFTQQRFWFLDQLDPGNPAYLMPVAMRIDGPLDRDRLRGCLEALIKRHETLRTGLMVFDSEPVQVIAAEAALPWDCEDLCAADPAQREALLQERIDLVVSKPFDLGQAPLLRTHLFRVDDQRHVLVLALHHSIADGWSLNILLRELAALYADGPEALPDLPIQYGDYVIWQQKWLAGPRLERQLAFWQAQLAGAPTALELPTDRPRPAAQTFRGALFHFTLPEPLTRQLQGWAAQHGCTLFMALLAGFQTLLYRYSGQTDLIVGTPVAGRPRVEMEGLVGCFANLLALRGDLAGNPSFATLAERVRAACLAAFANQDVPFERLIDELNLTRDPSRSPLAQAVLVLQNTPQPTLAFGQLLIEPIRIDNRAAKFDLLLDLVPDQDGLAGTVEYNTDLFDQTTIARMMAHWQIILEALARDPAARIDDLALLTPPEQALVLETWNRSQADYPRGALFHELFEAQAARQPEALAAVCEDRQISYGALNARANQLAHFLRRAGVGPDVPVALCLERSLEMVLAILGVLKAGGAYVPLDPEYPAERLQYMLDDSQPPLLLTTRHLRARLPETGARVVDLDADWGVIGQERDDNPARNAAPDHLAYIIYTSGSTGRPKGVMVRQGGMLNLCFGLRPFFNDPLVRDTALIASFSFDISVNQIFPTLLFGRTLHVIPDSLKYDSPALVRYLAQRQIQNMDAVPSYLNAVLGDTQGAWSATALRYLLVGGEKIERRLIEKLFQQLGPGPALVNIYGLTEISDINSIATISSPEIQGPVTIGRPLQNNRIYIVNRRDQLQPVGVAGELCISGESLARGYWGRPELTAEKFRPCPFEHGALMCRTGDLGYWRPDGTIVLLGRLDTQIKLRGFRIEVGEIEALLEQHPAVRENVVVVREDRPSDQRLVAYVVAHPGQPLDIADLQRYLQARLPAFMVPMLVLLAELPHTPSGKADRKRLPAPEPQEGGTVYTAPRTPTEAALALIWQEVLEVERVGVDDQFFELGGHSLLATRVMMRVKREFGVQIPLRRIFETPTVHHLASYIDLARRLTPLGYADPGALSDDDEEGAL
ncbi:MAG: hypothetical protein OHK0022_11910 [Roseiflexaceae bacterium]